jgi:hypothetical protein
MDEEREEHLEQLRVDAERAQRDLDAFRNLLSDRLQAVNTRIKTLLLHGGSAEEKAQAKSDRSSIQAQLQQKEQWAELRIKEYLDTKEEFQVSIIFLPSHRTLTKGHEVAADLRCRYVLLPLRHYVSHCSKSVTPLTSVVFRQPSLHQSPNLLVPLSTTLLSLKSKL